MGEKTSFAITAKSISKMVIPAQSVVMEVIRIANYKFDIQLKIKDNKLAPSTIFSYIYSY
jgi:hypothetical protein